MGTDDSEKFKFENMVKELEQTIKSPDHKNQEDSTGDREAGTWRTAYVEDEESDEDALEKLDPLPGVTCVSPGRISGKFARFFYENGRKR